MQESMTRSLQAFGMVPSRRWSRLSKLGDLRMGWWPLTYNVVAYLPHFFRPARWNATNCPTSCL